MICRYIHVFEPCKNQRIILQELETHKWLHNIYEGNIYAIIELA